MPCVSSVEMGSRAVRWKTLRRYSGGRCDGSRWCVWSARRGAPGSHVQNNRQTRPLSRDTATSGTTNSPLCCAQSRSLSICIILWYAAPHHSRHLTYSFFADVWFVTFIDIGSLKRSWKCVDLWRKFEHHIFFGRKNRNDHPFSSTRCPVTRVQ